MPQNTDLYSVMYSYAKKAGSPFIDMEAFIGFLEKYAKRICDEKPEWARWTNETGKKVWMDVNHLAEDGKLIIDQNHAGTRIHFCNYYAELIKEAYKNPDDDTDRPFHNEESLKIIIPDEQIKPLHMQENFSFFLEEPQKKLLPIIKLIFPYEAGNAIVLAPMIPLTLLEMAILKIRNYLLRHGNKEYVQHKLAPHLTGKDNRLQEIMDQILIRPNDCIHDIRQYREVSFHFWGYFCNLVRSDLKQKNELLQEDIAALQAAYIIEGCSTYYKALAVKEKEQEIALRNFDLEMDKPPYYFSREALLRFKDNKGMLLLDICGQEALDSHIKKRSTETVSSNELPDMVYFHTAGGAAWLIKKTRVLTACARLLEENRPLVIKAIFDRWKIMLKEFRKESAMDNDKDFETLTAEYIKEYVPVLHALLQDRKLFLIYEEMRSSPKTLPKSSQLFNWNELLPLPVLLGIKRKQILSDVKLLIPFWHSFLHGFFAFFKRISKKKKRKQAEAGKKITTGDSYTEMQQRAEVMQSMIVPRGQTLDSYIKTVCSRWNELLNEQAANNLVEDVNALVRDRFRALLRLQKFSMVSQDDLDTLAYTILDSFPSLRKIRDQNSLLLYIKLYLIKLLTARTVS
ncbi:MAG: hypothetical protein LBB72_08280 [Spirochaetaceae bacterium]|jgi:hypothetical protein|nr:hypothetical protein [Spirochaetaceae bacterium]